MTYRNEPQSRQTRKAQARRVAKDYVANMKVRLNDGGRLTIHSPKAAKIIERGTVHLFLNNGRPFATQISHSEAAAFLGDEVDEESRYAMAFAVDKNGNPYCTLPVEAFPIKCQPGPAPTSGALAQAAEGAAFRALFNDQLGLHPHRPLQVGQGRP